MLNKILGLIFAVIAIAFIVSLIVGMGTSQVRLIRQCFNWKIEYPILFMIVFSIFPFPFVGYILLAICGFMVMTGKCKRCDQPTRCREGLATSVSMNEALTAKGPAASVPISEGTRR
jgi:chromate transport protein ChrA